MSFRSLFDWMNPEKPVGRHSPNRNDDVAKVETLLGKAEYLKTDKTVLPTGKYGARTDKALRSFQRDYGLKVDGLVNPGGPTIRRLVDNTFRDDPTVPPPRPRTEAAGSGTGSRAGPDGRLSKVRAPSPPRATLLGPGSGAATPSAAPHVGGQPARVRAPASRRPTLLSPDFGATTPSAAPNVGDRQTPPESVAQSARKTRGFAPDSDENVLTGGAGHGRLGGGAPGKLGASGHGKRSAGRDPVERFSDADLDAAEKVNRDWVERWRWLRLNNAADNMERFLSGRGGIKEYTREESRQFAPIRDAEEKNQSRFENRTFLGNTKNAGAKRLAGLRDGDTMTFGDDWDRDYDKFDTYVRGAANPDYALGFGQLKVTSTGGFTATRRGNKIHITGTVTHKFKDRYDFHAGASSGYTTEAYMLQQSGRAKPFLQRGAWAREVSGTVDIGNGSLSNPRFTWTDTDLKREIWPDWEKDGE